jgi:hypothetical protein
MKYLTLYNYLVNEEGLTMVQAFRSISEVRKLQPEIKDAFKNWFDTRECDLVVEGVSFNDLTNRDKMKPVRAFKMLDWLKREPLLALHYLAMRPFRADLSKVGGAKIATQIDIKQDHSDI